MDAVHTISAPPRSKNTVCIYTSSFIEGGGARKAGDVVTSLDDLTLVDSNTHLAYRKPEGSEWDKQKLSKDVLERAKIANEKFLEEILKNGQYSEVHLAMGKQYAKALPDLSKF
jgi:hypothetical protein